MTVDTTKVKDRRSLSFLSFSEAIADAELLAETERQGTLRATGNWTLGQAIGHVATWARFPLDGYPEMPRPPWLFRVLTPIFKRVVLSRGLSAGVDLGVPSGTFGTGRIESGEAVQQLRESFDCLERQAPTRPNSFFGTLSHDEWIALNLRHAELHFSFFHPR